MATTADLKQTDIFYNLSDKHLNLIASLAEDHTYPVGEIILEENSPSQDLYVIVRGEVDILVDPSLVSPQSQSISRPTTIATLRRGQSFGEVALVDQGLRSAAVRSAAHNTEILIISGLRLLSACDRDPILGYQLMRNLATDLATKIRNSDFRIRKELLGGSL
jgi:CRP/FNR family transcriptional regulator, cyclic AMP receptor protein